MSNHHATTDDLKKLYDALSAMHQDWMWLSRVLLGLVIALPVLFVITLLVTLAVVA